jgi:carbon monoxide dehydrogenase subunit G
MEVKLDKRYPVAATLEQAWAVLSDIYATAACMPGAQITEQIDATHFKGTVKSKVGPAVMSFNGDIELQGLDAAAKELKMLGKGADKSGSSASMQLTAHLEPAADGDGCVLAGVATIIVSGKLAQFGSRLLVPVSDAMLAQFADNFRAAALAVNAAPPAEESTEIRMVQAAEAPGAMPAALPESAPAAVAAAPAPVAAPRPPMPRPPAAPVKELNALALMWTVIKGWFAGLFGKKS